MITPRRIAPTLRLLAASALGIAFALAPGCGSGDNPARHAGTIELPKRGASRVDAKAFAKGKTSGPDARR